METTLNLIGAITACWIYIFSILVFIARLKDRPKLEYAFGFLAMLAALPLLYLILKAPAHNRPALYYIQIGLMLLWIAVTLMVDYLLKIEFRDNPRWVIAYVILFFAGTGGMLGIAAAAGIGWLALSLVLFFLLAGLAFYQRAKTGK